MISVGVMDSGCVTARVSGGRVLVSAGVGVVRENASVGVIGRGLVKARVSGGRGLVSACAGVVGRWAARDASCTTLK